MIASWGFFAFEVNRHGSVNAAGVATLTLVTLLGAAGLAWYIVQPEGHRLLGLVALLYSLPVSLLLVVIGAFIAHPPEFVGLTG